jgi:hypothetical protein
MEATMMNVFGPLLLSSVLLVAITGSADAGPCSGEIARAQADADLRIDATAGAGASQPESVGAKLHHQPTPGSVAQAERKAGEGADNEQILALLAQARQSDELGDREACEKALKNLRSLLE